MKHTYLLYYVAFFGLFFLITPAQSSAFYASTDYLHVQDTIGPDMDATLQGEITKPKVGLYPNPTAGPVTLEINEDLWQGGTAAVYNIIGQLITQKSITEKKVDFDLTDGSRGVYFVTLRNGEAQKTLRLVLK